MPDIIRKLTGCLVFVIASLLPWHVVLPAATENILRKADQARGNLDGVTWDVTIVDKGRRRVETQTHNVKARGFDMVAETRVPPKFRGNRILMVSGNMWFYRPDLSKPVPISRRQRLLGQAAYGDLASTNYAEDYNATLLGEEGVDGETCYVFDLKSTDKRATYDAIKYWISKSRLVGVKAEYFTVSGKKLKTGFMRYESTVKVNGEMRPFISKITIYDDLLSKDTVTTLDMVNKGFQKLPDYLFNVDLLRK